MPHEVIIKAPSWVAAGDLFGLLRQDLQFKLAYYDSQCRGFEQKYQQTFFEFETSMRAAQENFDVWEDFMDWEAAVSARQELAHRLEELAAWKA